MNIVIRATLPIDAPRLAELRYALRSSVGETPEARDAFIARCTEWMQKRLTPGSRWCCWVATDATNVIVGCVWVQRVEKLPNPNGLPGDNAYLSNFYVSETLRSTGIGSRLLHAALSWCDSNGIDRTFLWPTARSRALYARYGFSSAGGIMERPSR